MINKIITPVKRVCRIVCRMVYRIMGITIFLCCLNAAAYAEDKKAPELISFDYQDLVSIRQNIRSGKNSYMASYKKLLLTTNKLLNKVPDKVTNGDLPPTGDPHDFFTIGKFSWPNPKTPDGMPYVRGDGKHNQEAFGPRYDLTRFQRTVNDVNLLALSWFYTQDEKYAAKAKELLQVWFLEPSSRMNPNMNCASALPGVYNGMSEGIIFSVILIEMLDHVKLLGLSKSWDSASNDALKAWVSDYMTWLETSDFGKKEKAALNNHGTWYSAQFAAYSIFTGKKENAAGIFELAKKRIDGQVAEDGSLPRELRRVESYHYFLYGLRAFVTLSRGLEMLGYNLASYKTPDNRSLILPFNFIVPYILDQKKWNYGGKVEPEDKGLLKSILWAYGKYQTPELLNTLNVLRPSFEDSTGIEKLYNLIEFK